MKKIYKKTHPSLCLNAYFALIKILNLRLSPSLKQFRKRLKTHFYSSISPRSSLDYTSASAANLVCKLRALKMNNNNEKNNNKINNNNNNEQKGCRKGSYGCKEQLLANRMIMENMKSRARNLSTAWIDYKKSFDSVPQSWIIKSLHLSSFHQFSCFSYETMGNDSSFVETERYFSYGNIKINSGIFQDDSLSPLLFCLALFLLTKIINNSRYGYKMQNSKINHSFYMDDFKLYASNDNELEGLIKTVKVFSDNIGMQFELKKCAKASFKQGKLVKTSNIIIDNQTIIKGLEQEKYYKYLGVNESDGIQHAKMKEQIKKECIRRVRLITETELNAKNRILAVNTLALPVMTFSYNIINLNLNELKKINVKIRKLLTFQRMHQPKEDVARLYIPKNKGGRGLMQLELCYKTTTIELYNYLTKTKDWMLKLTLHRESSTKSHSVVKESMKFKKKFDIEFDYHQLEAIEVARKMKKKR